LVSCARSTESNSSLSAELKRVTRELASYKIELDQTRKYLHSVLQNSSDMIFMTEVTGLLVSFSSGAEKALGYSMDEVIGRPLKDFALDRKTFEGLLATYEKKGYARALDVLFRHKEGQPVHCHVSLMGLTNREDGKVGTIGVCTDITQWKRLQDDLVQIDRLAEIGRIASGVAHEINNPLAVMSEASGWGVEVVKDAKGLNPDDREELEGVLTKIGAQTRRCRNITHRLLDFVRDSAPTNIQFDIHELLKETIDFLKPELKHTTIEIALAFVEGSLPVNSDPRLMEQVFVNLITNAIHAVQEKGEEGGRIEIGTQKTTSGVEITVGDNGVGISEKNRAKMFNLFYTTKPPGKGTGLGLAICRNIITKLGGNIAYQSELGVGTTFTVKLPV